MFNMNMYTLLYFNPTFSKDKKKNNYLYMWFDKFDLMMIGTPNAHLVIVETIPFHAKGLKLNMVVNIGGKYGRCYVRMDVNMQHMI